MDFANLRTLFFKWLPGFLMLLVLMRSGRRLCAANSCPVGRLIRASRPPSSLQQAVISTQVAEQSNNDNQLILQAPDRRRAG